MGIDGLDGDALWWLYCIYCAGGSYVIYPIYQSR